MPTVKQNIDILRNGVQKRRTQESETKDDSTFNIRLPIRDHYERFERFTTRQYPKRRRDRFVDEDTADQAKVADRDTSLGILDTLARQFITFWLPEIELFLAEDAFNDPEVEREAYVRHANGLENNVIRVSDRIDCTIDTRASTLREALQERTMHYLVDLYEACKDVLDDEEKSDLDPSKRLAWRNQPSQPPATTPKKVTLETLSEARTLNSSGAWDLSEKANLAPTTLSHRVRYFSPIRQLDYADAADNGRAWSTAEPIVNNNKFEFEFFGKLQFTATKNLQDRMVMR